MALSDMVIKSYLDAHRIETRQSHGVLYALDVWTSDKGTNCQWVLASGWTKQELLAWHCRLLNNTNTGR